FNGIRCDFGFRRGDRILPDYDPMIGKLIATGESRKEALLRMERSLNELYIRGITTNQYQLLRIIRCQQFQDGDYTNRLLDHYTELSQPLSNNSLIRHSVILGALSENINLIREKRDEIFLNKDLEAVIHKSDLLNLPEAFDVEIQNRYYEVRFFQTSITRFYVYINQVFQGEAELLPALSSTNDYTFRFEYRSYSVRVDRRSTFHIIRFPDENGRIHFMKMRIINRGAATDQDSVGLVRSPIQGSFVKLHSTEKGKPINRGIKVKKGDPIIVLSAMKMESTIVAPIDGTISYIIEDGDVTRLELGKTSDNRIIGRSITEGEVLFVIENKSLNTEDQKPHYSNSITEADLPTGVNPNYLRLFKDDFQNHALNDPDQSLSFVLEVANLFYLGFNTEAKGLIQSIKELLKVLPENYDLSRIIGEQYFTNLLATFTENKRLFSPLSGGNVSYFREIYRLFSRWNDVSYQLPSPFKYTIQNVFQSYNVTDWRSTAEYESSFTRTAFLFILRSFHSTRDLPDYILYILKHIASFRSPSNQLKNLLRKLVLQEEAEQEHSIAALGSETLNHLGLRSWNIEMTYWVSRKYLSDLKKMKSHPLSFSHIDHQLLRTKINQSLELPSTDLIPLNVTGILKQELERKLNALQKEHSVERLYSPKEKIAMYLVTDSTGNQRYFALGLIDKVTPFYNNENRLIGSESVERTDIDAVRVMNAYQSIRYLRNNVVDMV
ncbi:MAG: hypothetical protein H3C43_12195, partial [Leptonema sp. (in: Bacteria)]|nr:hypothetical protein [Leptonema sp. (in: bacteria)]